MACFATSTQVPTCWREMIPLCPQAARENKRHSYTLYTKTPFRPSCSCVRAEGHKFNCANDRPCMPIWAAFVRHKATYVKLFPIYMFHHFSPAFLTIYRFKTHWVEPVRHKNRGPKWAQAWKRNEELTNNIICTKKIRSTPAEIDEVVPMRLPQLLINTHWTPQIISCSNHLPSR